VLSQHPADRVIRELIATRRRATAAEVAAIVARMANVPFDGRIVSVRAYERGARYQGHRLGAREDSLRYHLIKRVAIEEQWSDGATIHSYLADLRRAVLAPTARLLVYERRGGTIAATITPTDDVLEGARQGSRSLPNLLVVYSADRGQIITGYQFSTWSSTGLPEEVVWLK
jgi:hypothetical protein